MWMQCSDLLDAAGAVGVGDGHLIRQRLVVHLEAEVVQHLHTVRDGYTRRAAGPSQATAPAARGPKVSPAHPKILYKNNQHFNTK